MKHLPNPNANRFEAWIQRERNRPVPEVNVRVGVRRSLEGALHPSPVQDALDVLIAGCSGIRAWVLTGLATAAILAMGMVAYQQLESLQSASMDADLDQVSVFIESGDWSELL